MAVVVQRMVEPQAAGILFTADPVTGNRRTATVEASFGLGEALVSGLVSPDRFQVRDGRIVARTIGTKERAVTASPSGGTEERTIERERRGRPALTDDEVVRLVEVGRVIESHAGGPQDIEWCLADDGFWIVQARAITTVFPIPDARDDQNHVYLSVGHAQMMTDAMKPLGLSFWQMTTPRPMAEAGNRLFVDVTAALASPAGRAALLDMTGKTDPLTRDALETILARDGFIRTVPLDGPAAAASGSGPARASGSQPPAHEAALDADPALVDELIRESQASIAALKDAIATKTGPELMQCIRSDIPELRRVLSDPRGRRVFMTAIEASWWLNDHLETWLGEKNLADTLTRSVPNNTTSEMGLALMGVADRIRPHREVVAFLERVEADGFLEELPVIPGGRVARDAIERWLATYGMRCVGEIDITRPRWAERPGALVPLILGNIRTFEPGAGERRFEEGRREAESKEREVLERLRGLPDGEARAVETKAMIDRVRTFIGYREYPKYGMVSRYFVYKQALLGEAERLVRAGVLTEPQDVFFLRFDELAEVVRTQRVDDELIRARKDDFAASVALRPPRVLTSEGEGLNGGYRRADAPPGALLGLPVSAGTVEGRARVILDIAEADLEPGDILVTAYTDPSWTPLFVAIEGLVTEVGGSMTHGAVIAREYGLPAVVGVGRATTLIHDGQRIRVDGTNGTVEILA
ncbi:MAG TPA: rifamycin-inactivating phosphotransferase, partial [Candidatus Limnocylindrales bacterium]|nr:rifamycin-inactivating phosphotransferase [Candidatus Limnocylindrales bacterium]